MYCESITADPADINILPEYGQDPRTVDKLIDGVNLSTDDMHAWLAPLCDDKKINLVSMKFSRNFRIALIRIWNYNKSRIHSGRGVK